MKIALRLLRICFLAVGIFLMGIGCSRKTEIPEISIVSRHTIECPRCSEQVEVEVKRSSGKLEVSTPSERFPKYGEVEVPIREIRSGRNPFEVLSKVEVPRTGDTPRFSRPSEFQHSDEDFEDTDEQWKAWVAEKEKNGYKVLSSRDSKDWLEDWLEKRNISPSIKDNSSVNGTTVVGDPRYTINYGDAIITVDGNGNHRVAVKKNN